MYFKKKLRKADKEIVQENDFIVDSQDNAVINIKATENAQIFSQYNYDSNDKLNGELSDFILEKAKFVPVSQDIKIKMYTSENVNSEDVKKSIRNNFKRIYVESKNELKQNFIQSLILMAIGLVFMTFLLLMHTYFYNIYFDVIVEIITWVFIWESVDSYCLRRASLRRKNVTLLKLYSAEIEVVKLKTLTKKQGNA